MLFHNRHLFARDKQHCRADHQQRTYDVEYRGAYAAGGGKLGTRVVHNLNGSVFVVFIVTVIKDIVIAAAGVIKFNLDTRGLRIIALGRDIFLKLVGALFEPVDKGGTCNNGIVIGFVRGCNAIFVYTVIIGSLKDRRLCS